MKAGRVWLCGCRGRTPGMHTRLTETPSSFLGAHSAPYKNIGDFGVDGRVRRAHRLGACQPGYPPSRLLGLLLAGVLTLSACATRVEPPQPEWSAAPALTAVEAVAALRRSDAQLQSLRARFTATLHSAEPERRARGVVLVKKPDRLRLRLLSPFGLTVLDYCSKGAHALMQLPLAGETWVDGEIDRHGAFSPSAFAPAFLLDHAVSVDGCREHGDQSYVECWDKVGGERRSVQIGLHPAVVLREIFYKGDAPALTLAYSDHRRVDGLTVPFRVSAEQPGSAMTMEIEIEAYEINPVLDDALFDASGSAP